MLNLDTSVEDVPKIGTAYAKKLKKLGIKTVQDLLFYFPARYDDFSDIIPIKKVEVGQIACVQGRIVSVDQTHTFKKGMDITEVVIEDETGQITALWFNQPYLVQSLKEDQYICLAGKVSLGKDGLYLSNPAYERIYEDSLNENLTHTGRIIPVYSETKGVTSRWLRYVIKPLLTQFHTLIPEILPPEMVEKQKFLPISEAIWQAHFPESFEYADAAKARFAFEDLLLLQLSVLKEKAKLLQNKAQPCPMDATLMKEFTKSLPFQLTDSQRQCAFTILKDLEKPVPMQRLLQGDVGSGKTVVSTMAALNTVKCGYQVAFMAPTEILAKQHFLGISNMLEKFDAKVAFLSGKGSQINGQDKVTKKELLKKLETGEIDILIGTQALISKGVKFKNLALIVLDEQHRFGVNQRAELTREKRTMPHLLSMTATPIPRTLALTVYGDLDLSLIKEMPKNRKKIITTVVGQSDRQKAYEFIKNEVKQGRGVFVICPKIEQKDSEASRRPTSGNFVPQNYSFGFTANQEIKSVKQEYEKLSKEIFPDLRITMLYGKMKAEEKERIMQDFKKGEIDILLSTSVVEVGVDVPRATIMMIEGAERFGLSQLHQFRGRVGRSDMQSYCFLFTTEESQQNRKRLKAMERSSNGFELAEEDLKIRGPGQLYGTQQWGLPDTAMQNLSNIFLIEKTRSEAKELLEKDPTLQNYPLLKARLKHFEQKIHFE
ncbi:MAG: ATP-dependent DNA helicase RecG [Candidatus Staskawiczbacteria bacterium RIFCSPHIGHO2_02_FULL_43_16]|uniref:ATP-dependent DNA helicase RecG n=1 Tax=Candidatus Staskawiczbacteria bacterium RIFCSPHIGHO2_01_FULL_41_41 TaxID=1802203 RepID=A0A1G2HVI7_9BACT|nr:MAG: ATP-dependent DNA helicase RecG [Candidatus Staskawiczbacteria bacterium RIFCSPHIGHO2_01_FULL_41_41]OGZ68164.1 MAG: ATP-dependent DNA helicase RecG [Candidatus Staskawiczbacteria bacterium RIFCSPHIGHO2_02_FULL_43_16]OGZ74954.1 MAG: ATP-dependent DNA helicase RecG [Candidatus Staskawiczbacteria bacterium RIFCSPLOWO2_01_FULL_43_17b]